MNIDICVDYSSSMLPYDDVDDYSVKFPHVEIVGNPQEIMNPYYLGHMVNDFCKMTKIEQKDVYEKKFNERNECCPWPIRFSPRL